MIGIEKGSGNVYADLGRDDAEEMLVKAQLAAKIGEIIRTRKWTQQKAADVLGMTQPKLSKMLRGQFRGISEAKMLDCLTRLGRDVQIVVGPARRRAASGHGVRSVIGLGRIEYSCCSVVGVAVVSGCST